MFFFILPGFSPPPVQNIPIKHLVFIVQENHTFDNYFGTYPGADVIPPNTHVPIDPNKTSLGYVAPFRQNATRPITIVGDQ
jgi:phospholipase C